MEIALTPLEGSIPCQGVPNITLSYPTIKKERHATVRVTPNLNDLPESLEKILKPFADIDDHADNPCPRLWITTSLSGTSTTHHWNYKGTMIVEDASESSGILKTLSEYCGEGGVELTCEMRLQSIRWSHNCEDIPAGSGELVNAHDVGWYWGMENAKVAFEPSSGKYGCKKAVHFVPRLFRGISGFQYEDMNDYYHSDNRIFSWFQHWKSRWHSYAGNVSITVNLPNEF